MKTSSSRIITPFFFLILLLSAGCRPVPSKDQVCFRNQCADVEIVDDEQKRQRGLQGRDRLADNAGMLFIFPESRPHSFWMKDTLIALDMIWLDQSQRIVYIHANTQPCLQSPCLSYTPMASALYVLELNAGKTKEWGLSVGDRMEFRFKEYLTKHSARLP